MAGSPQDLQEILGKTIKGVVIKRDKGLNTPMGQVFLVFTDDTTLEFYSDRPIFPSRVAPGGMEYARSYLTPPHGTMEIRMDVSLDEE